MGWIKDIKNQRFGPGKYSQNNEDQILKYIFENIGTVNKFLVDLGAWDGFHLSNTRLFIEQGWQGLLIDGKDFPNVYRSFITKENILETLRVNWVPKEFDLLSIDIDGNDYWVLREVLSQYKPRLIISEFNSEHPLDQAKTIAYNPSFTFFPCDYYGYTYGAGLKLAEEFGYTVIYQNSNMNMYYLRNDLVTEAPDFPVQMFKHWSTPGEGEWIYIN